jgi:hypothetical protein
MFKPAGEYVNIRSMPYQLPGERKPYAARTSGDQYQFPIELIHKKTPSIKYYEWQDPQEPPLQPPQPPD